MQKLIGKYLKREQSIYCAFVDFAKFFDSIQRKILWAKLIKLGVSDRIVKLLRDMYDGSSFSVRFNVNEISDFCTTRTGVQQGDVLSPLLANLFTADLEDFLGEIPFPHFPYLNNEEVKFVQFADDLALYPPHQ